MLKEKLKLIEALNYDVSPGELLDLEEAKFTGYYADDIKALPGYEAELEQIVDDHLEAEAMELLNYCRLRETRLTYDAVYQLFAYVNDSKLREQTQAKLKMSL